MTWAEDLRRFTATVQTRTHDVFVDTATEALRSIVEGSEITGAPGQPVDTGALRASWQLTYDEPTTAVISTNLVYAPIIEDGMREASLNVTGRGQTMQAITLRSEVGGFHSVRLTRAGIQRIVDVMTARRTGAA